MAIASRVGIDPIALSRGVAAGEFPPAALDWLRAGFLAYVEGAAPLEVALQLTGGCRIAARNRSLRTAAQLIRQARPELSAWDVAGLLEQRLARFESGALVHIRKGLNADLDPVDDCLLRAIQTGAKPLRSRRRLFDLLGD